MFAKLQQTEDRLMKQSDTALPRDHCEHTLDNYGFDEPQARQL